MTDQSDTLALILAEMQAESDAVDEEAERNSINSPEYERRLRLLGLTARHFLRERAKQANGARIPVAGPQRFNGTVLFSTALSDAQYYALRAVSPDAHYEFIGGILRRDEDEFVYAWKHGHVYRNGTTPDKFQPGCRVSFEVNPATPTFATGISWRLVDEPPSTNAIDPPAQPSGTT